MASEDVARRNEKLAALGVLAAGLAHEVRNPLTAIKARLFIQQRGLPSHSPALEDARIIDREINRLEGIVRTVLAFARPTPPEPVVVDPARVLEQVRQLVLADCARQDIRVHLDCPKPMAFRADAAQVHQVVLNLVRNAVEAVGRGGSIHLRVLQAPRRFGDRMQAGVMMQIEDDGPGIPPTVQERLFDPFFTTKPEGTGLGLAISARIVEGNGGVLEFASEAGRGTLFSVVFPSVP
jgi:signal transduction histidine kinase